MSNVSEPTSLTSIIDRLDYRISKELALLCKYEKSSVKYQLLSAFTKVFEIVGSSATTIPLAAYATWHYRTQPPVSAVFLNLTILQLLNIALIGAIKGIVRRPRPSYSANDNMFLTRSVDVYSFPSGHTVQMVLITYFSLLYMDNLLHKCGMFVLCSVISVLRVFTGRHYLFDVLGGAVISFNLTSFYLQYMWVSGEVLSYFSSEL